LEAGEAPVWARNGIATFRCPKSAISAESVGWLELHAALSRFGAPDVMSLPAKGVEAYFAIENEVAKERSNG
jgi:hypothetical protein